MKRSVWFVLGFVGICLILLFVVFWFTSQPVHEAKITPTPSSQPEPTATPTSTPIIDSQQKLKNQGAYLAPLTGVGQLQFIGENRPIAVMINNHRDAYPQSGLQQADIVYEILAEGEITRYIAIFQSEIPDIIGPVRSIRPYYVRLGEAIQAILVHAGWSQEAMNLMTELKSDHLDGVYQEGFAFWRTTDRKAPHNLYTSKQKIDDAIRIRTFSTAWDGQGYLFAEQDVASGNLHKKEPIQIPYILGYSVSYEYDEKEHVYNRYRNQTLHLDQESGMPITVANVLIVETSHEIVDSIGHRHVDINGPGQGILLQQGSWQQVEWKLQDGLIRAYVQNQEVAMMRGKTWIQVVPLGTLKKIVRE